MKRDTISYFIDEEGSIQQEDLTILNIYAPNVGDAKYINQLITKAKKYLDNNTLTLGYFNLVLFFKILFIHDRHTEGERERHRQREKQTTCKEPDVGLDPRTPGSCPGLKARR